MPFTPMTFTQIAELLATQYSAQAALPANTNQGSTLGAVFNATALMALNVQNELSYVQSISRMQSSVGADIDSWGTQFNLPRIGATASSGTVTFSTSTPAISQIVIPVNGIVQTTGGLQFQVIAPVNNLDPNYTNYSAVLGGYPINVGQSSVNATVLCTATGIIGNVAGGTITLVGSLGSSPMIVGISTLTNPLAFTNGQASEADAAYQTRMTITLSTGTVATHNAVAGAILGVQAGLTYSIGDTFDISGTPGIGRFTVVVNQLGNGTTPPSSTLLANVSTAVQSTRTLGINAFVRAPYLTTIDVQATISVTATGTVSVAQALTNIQALVVQYLNGIGLDPYGGNTYAELSELYVIMRTYPNVTNVKNLQLRVTGGAWVAADIVAGWAQQLVSSGTVTLTVG